MTGKDLQNATAMVNIERILIVRDDEGYKTDSTGRTKYSNIQR